MGDKFVVEKQALGLKMNTFSCGWTRQTAELSAQSLSEVPGQVTAAAASLHHCSSLHFSLTTHISCRCKPSSIYMPFGHFPSFTR